MPLTKEKKERLILVGAVALMAVAGVYYGLVGTAKTQMAKQSVELGKAKQDLEIAKIAVRNWERFQADLTVVSNSLQLIESEMVSAEDPLSWAYALLKEMSKDHPGVAIVPEGKPSVSVTGVGLPSGFSYTNAVFGMKGEATYEDLGEFLADFENRFPYFHIQDLTVYTGARGADGEADRRKPGQLRFTMKLVALLKPSQWRTPP